MNRQFKMTGVVERIFDTETVNDKFRKRVFVINDMDEKYPQLISFQCIQDRVTILDTLGEGQEVEVAFNLRGREWTSPDGETKYFNTLEAWRVEATGAATEPAQATTTDTEMPF